MAANAKSFPYSINFNGFCMLLAPNVGRNGLGHKIHF